MACTRNVGNDGAALDRVAECRWKSRERHLIYDMATQMLTTVRQQP